MSEVLYKIKDFCAVRNVGPAYDNSFKPTPRAKFICEMLKNFGIPFEIDRFFVDEIPMYNIILQGNSKRVVVAHHDIRNPLSENANDNSASIINAIYLKQLRPETNVVFTDAEECGFWGSKRLASMIVDGKLGDIEWVLNLELTGKGGKNIMVGNHPGPLMNSIVEKFQAPVANTPPSDCFSFEDAGIDTTVLNPLALLSEGKSSDILGPNGYLDNSTWYHCHSLEDSLDKISISDMQEFVEEVLVPIMDQPSKDI